MAFTIGNAIALPRIIKISKKNIQKKKGIIAEK